MEKDKIVQRLTTITMILLFTGASAIFIALLYRLITTIIGL